MKTNRTNSSTHQHTSACLAKKSDIETGFIKTGILASLCAAFTIHLLAITLTVTIAPAPAHAQVDTTAENQQFLFAYGLQQRGDLKASAEAFDSYLGSFPKGSHRSDALYLRGYVAWRLNQPTIAMGFLDQVKMMNKIESWKLHFLRGLINNKLKKYKEALASVEQIKTSELKPNDKALVMFESGIAYFMTGNLNAAEKQLKFTSELKSHQQPDALLLLAKTQARLTRQDDAIKTLAKCLTLGNTSAEAEAARIAGQLSYEAKKYEPAIKYYGIIISRHQTSEHFAPVLLKTMWAMLFAGQKDELLLHFEQYKAKLNLPDRAEAWFLAGRSNQLLGKHKEAVALFTTVAAFKTGSAIEDQLLYRKAQSQFELTDYDGMATTLDSLAAKHPKSTYLPTADYMRYRADMKLSDTNRAAARLSSIVDKGETHPYYTTAIIERASLYRRTSKWDAARKDYETYIKLADDPKNNIKDLNETLVDLQDTYIRLGELKLAGQTATRLLATAKLPPLLEQQTLFRHALVLIKTKKLAEAATTLKQLATKHPQNEFIGQVHYYNGLLLMAAGKTDDAAKQLQASLGDQKLPRKLRAQALLLVSIRQRERNEDDNAATTLAALKKAIGLDRMRTDDLLWLAKYYVDREPGSVFLYTEQLIDGKRKVADDKRAIALFLTGRALQSSTDQEGINAAIQSFKEVEALGHGYGILARLEIARTQARAGKRDESLRNYKGLMTVKDSTIAGTAIYEAAQVHRQMAAQKEAFSDTVGAKAEYKEAYNLFYRLTVLYGFKELSPLPELAHIQRAELATKVDKPDDNSKSLNELLKRFPQGPYAIYAKAMQAMNTKKDTEAANLLRSLRQKKTDPRLAARIHTRLRELEGSK